MRFTTILLGLLLLTATAQAHEFWFTRLADGIGLVYGHGPQERDSYPPTWVRKALGQTRDGRLSTLDSRVGDACLVFASDTFVALGAEVDTGLWVKTMRGWHQGSLSEHPDAMQSQRQVQYVTTVLAPGAQPFGFALEFQELAPGRLRLIHDGQPLPDQVVRVGSDREKVRTDAQGELILPPGTRQVSTTLALPRPDESAFKELSLLAIWTDLR